MDTRSRILIAGIGNIFLGDDAFGVEVAQRLTQRPLPRGVEVVDFGIRGLDLAYALADGYDTVFLVDAAPRGEAPGTLYVLEITTNDGEPPAAMGPAMEMHNLDPVRVLRLATTLGANVRRVMLVGCEPAAIDVDDMQAGLSASVRAAVDEAVTLIESLLEKLLQGDPATEDGTANHAHATKEVGICPH